MLRDADAKRRDEMKKLKESLSFEGIADAMLDVLNQRDSSELEECVSKQKLQCLKERMLKKNVDAGYQVLLKELLKNSSGET